MAEVPPTTHIDRTGREFTIRIAQRDDAGAALAYIRSVAADATASPAAQIEQASQLKDAGTITTQEFESIKAKALA